VPALEPILGWRVVAEPVAIDRARWAGDDVVVVRFAPDEAFGIGATGVEMDDPDAITVAEAGFAGIRLSAADLSRVAGHVDWALPTEPGILAQGKIAGVPAKLLSGDPALLLIQAGYGHDLLDRLGWLP
jgi:hypothetical protein